MISQLWACMFVGMASPTSETSTRAQVRAFVEDFASAMEGGGLHRMTGRVLGAVLVSESGGLTSRELGEFLGVSAAAVSQSVRQLEAVDFVRRRRAQGERTDRFDLADTPWFESSVSQALVFARLASILSEGSDALPEGSAARARLNDSAHFFRYMAAEIPRLIRSWREAEALSD